MNQTLKLVLYGLAVVLVVAAIGSMLRSSTTSTEGGDTDALVSRLIANDPLIAPVTARQAP